jgi:hypothetical protein
MNFAHFLYIFCTSLFKINYWICKTHKDLHVSFTDLMIDLEKWCAYNMSRITMLSICREVKKWGTRKSKLNEEENKRIRK